MKKTVFVVGAGASSDFGLPLGSELVVNIRDRLRNEIQGPPGPIVSEAARSNISGDYYEAAQQLAAGLIAARSIDRLLHSRRDKPAVTLLGKCAIAAAIQHYESQSPLGSFANGDWNSIQSGLVKANGSWLARLFSMLQEGISPNDASQIFESCSFVTFNYDRCIEYYLTMAFIHILSLPSKVATDIVNNIPIIHVYGSLGRLPSYLGAGLPFGGAEYRALEAANQIRTFTEGLAGGTLDEIEKLIEQAERIAFMGFAFDPMNVDAIFSKKLGEYQSIIGTSLGAGPIEIDNFQTKAFGVGVPVRGALIETKCDNLLLRNEFRGILAI